MEWAQENSKLINIESQLNEITSPKNLPIELFNVETNSTEAEPTSLQTHNLQIKMDYEESSCELDSEFYDSEIDSDFDFIGYESDDNINSIQLEDHKKSVINYRMGRLKINLNKFNVLYECLICLNDFKTFEEFSAPEHTEDDEHIDCSDSDMNVPDINDNYIKITGEIYISKYPRKYSLICFLCQAEVIDYDEIVNHMKTKHSIREKNLEFKYYKCNQCEEVYSEIEKLEEHVQIHPVMKPFKCSYCKSPAFFKTPTFLYKHEQNHIDKLFKNKCKLCGKLFNGPTILRTHIAVVHEGKKEFTCDICEKKFAHPRSLQYHNRTHTGELPYQCQLCGRRFIDKKILLNHIQTHTMERPYECKICEKSYSTSSTLLQHKKAFHMSETIGRKYKCLICLKSYVAKYQLRLHNELKHEKQNMIYKCLECTNEYSHPFKLKTHVRNCHRKVGVFRCMECDKVFDLSQRLKQHINRVHSTIITCELCGLSLKSKYSFDRHRKNCNGTIDSITEKVNHFKEFSNINSTNMDKTKYFKCSVGVNNLKKQMQKNYNCSPFNAEEYNKKMNHKINLKRTRSQFDGYTFQCNQCDKNYTNEKSLKNHLRLKHRN